MPGLKTVKELRAEVERLTRLNARYRRELRAAKQSLPLPPVEWLSKTAPDDLLCRRPGGVVEVPREFLEGPPQQPWYRRCWNWLTGR